MGRCTIDHSREDVLKKLQEQKEFLPHSLSVQINDFLQQTRIQTILNDLFHLLKKYDLSSEAERSKRNANIVDLITS